MIFRPYLYEPTACASYLLGCLSKSQLAVVDPHVELVDAYLTEAVRVGAPIVAVFETHVQADHSPACRRSSRPLERPRTCLPAPRSSPTTCL